MNSLYGPNAMPPSKRSLDARAIAGAPSFTGERQYIASVKVRKFGLDGSFNVYVFLGDGAPDAMPRTWAEDASFIGVTGMFAQTGSVATEMAQQEANGEVPLTAALEAKVRSGELQSLEEDVVAAYLRANLKWKISKVCTLL